MNKEFIPYEQALALKELGFNEECFSYIKHLRVDNNNDKVHILSRASRSQIEDMGVLLLEIPTFSQAFRFFREEHKIHIVINTAITNEWYFELFNLREKRNCEIKSNDMYFASFEEAQLECLKKLIEIEKKTKQ